MSTTGKGRKTRHLSERFWEKVDKDGPIPEHRPDLGPCWLWAGSKNEKGYGSFRFDGKTSKAHRVSWMLAHGRIPSTVEVCHACDNRSCVRLSHLFCGTHALNLADMVDKGRSAKGERHSQAKLTSMDVRAIRERYAGGSVTQLSLAAAFGTCRSHISRIVNDHLWKESVCG